MSKNILAIVLESVEYLNQMLIRKLPVDKGVDCPLFGESGLLDSMSLVSLIVDLEERLEKKFNRPYILASEKAMSRKRSPFLNVGSLCDYIEYLNKGAVHV